MRFFLLLVAVAAVMSNEDLPPGMIVDGHDAVYANVNHEGQFGPASVSHGPRCGYIPGDQPTAAINISAARAFQALKVDIIFHVVHASDGKGLVSESMLDDQVKVLDRDFQGSNINFDIAKIYYHENDRYFTGCGGNQATRMFESYAVDPERYLNIYTCSPDSGILGYAYFPEQNRRQAKVDGVVLLYSTLPDGGARPYDKGATGTHEVGHYLGLYHTFQGGCNYPGDHVDDTPYESSPVFGCPATAPHTCGSDDDYTNFMDYVDDECMDHFTEGQIERMKALSVQLRPGLFSNN